MDLIKGATGKRRKSKKNKYVPGSASTVTEKGDHPKTETETVNVEPIEEQIAGIEIGSEDPQMCQKVTSNNRIDLPVVNTKSQDVIFRLSVGECKYFVTAKAYPDTDKTRFETYCNYVLNKINPTDNHIQAVVIVPTPLISEQLVTAFQKLSKILKKDLVVISGKFEAGKLYSQGQIIVATFTHIHELINSRVISLAKCNILVIDAINDLFPPLSDYIEPILKETPKAVDILLYSGTFPLNTKELMKLPRICSTTPNECAIDLKKEFLAFKKDSISKSKERQSKIKTLEDKSKEQQSKIKMLEDKSKEQQSKIKTLENNITIFMKSDEQLQKSLKECLDELLKLKSATST